MSVLCTVIWHIKPECADDFVQTIGGMFPDTKTHKGFISIRLMRSDTTENEFILVQEWETTQNHQAYAKYRAERRDIDRLIAMTAGSPHVHYWSQDALASA